MYIILAYQVILNMNLPSVRWLALVVWSVLRWAQLTALMCWLLWIFKFVHFHLRHALFDYLCVSLNYSGWWRPRYHHKIRRFTQNPIYCAIIWWLWEHCWSASDYVLLVFPQSPFSYSCINLLYFSLEWLFCQHSRYTLTTKSTAHHRWGKY